jgi:hypothetical protein
MKTPMSRAVVAAAARRVRLPPCNTAAPNAPPITMPRAVASTTRATHVVSSAAIFPHGKRSSARQGCARVSRGLKPVAGLIKEGVMRPPVDIAMPKRPMTFSHPPPGFAAMATRQSMISQSFWQVALLRAGSCLQCYVLRFYSHSSSRACIGPRSIPARNGHLCGASTSARRASAACISSATTATCLRAEPWATRCCS